MENNLNPGDVSCPECDGKGYHDHTDELPSHCFKCNGVGKLDWIENVVGKKSEFFIEKTRIVAKNRMLEDKWVIRCI